MNHQASSRRLSSPWTMTLVIGALLVAGVALGLVLAALHDAGRAAAPRTVTVGSNAGFSPSLAEDEMPISPTLDLIPMEDASNIPFPSGTIGATSTYTESDGRVMRQIYAGSAGCGYGLPNHASCVPNGNADHEQIGMIIETVDDATGLRYGAPILLPGTGPITFTRIDEGKVFFTTESGVFGAYSLSARKATVYALRAFASSIALPPTINRVTAGQRIPVRWRLTDQAGRPIADYSTFLSVTSVKTPCSAAYPTKDLEASAITSGLNYEGDGWWTVDWMTRPWYAGQCRVMNLNLAGLSVGPTALFQFR